MPYRPPAFTARPSLRACRSCAAAGPHPPRPRPTPRCASYALLSTRQKAKAFNQPLSFDTSSVKAMSNMFKVRFARRARRLHQRRPTPSRASWAAPRPTSHARFSTRHRTQTPCPTLTSCSSVARWRAPRPLPLLVTAGAGVRGFAPRCGRGGRGGGGVGFRTEVGSASYTHAEGGRGETCDASSVRMTSYARAVSPVMLSPFGGAYCGCRHARAA